jgi:hypothetical protein
MGDIAALVPARASAFPSISLDDYADLLGLGMLPLRLHHTLTTDREEIGADYAGLAFGAFRTNATVFAVEMKRLSLFSQVRFAWKRRRNNELWTDSNLRLLEHPETGETTSDLLYRILLYADFGGDVCIVRRPGRLRVLRPDWTVVVLGSRDRSIEEPRDIDLEMIGIIYCEGGIHSGREPESFLREEFAHFAPIRDPLARYRGMPWLLPVIRTIQADTAATTHKLKFFENGATANQIVTLDPTVTLENARKWIELFEQEHKGALNAYKTIYLGGGAKHEVVGANFQQMDFKVVQGAGQTLIAAAGGIHPTIAGLSEGLQGSSLNAGNFREAAQLVGDTFLRPQWENLVGSLEVIIPPPDDGSVLWYDESRVSFLKDDVKDAAEVLAKRASSIRVLTDGGYTPETVVQGVTSGDLGGLKHAGYLPVQVQPIQADAAADSDPTKKKAADDDDSKAALPAPVPASAKLPAPAGEPVYDREVRCTTPGCEKVVGKATATGTGVQFKCKACGELVAV